MAPDNRPISASSTEKTILSRFLHLLSAQGAEGAFSALFFLYLSWVNATLYGEVMYALAAGAIVMKVVEFGLYYPQVRELGAADRSLAPQIISRVNVLRIAFVVPVMVAVTVAAIYRESTPQMAWILFFVCLGIALGSLSETFFADLRVRGRQDREARIKILSSVAAYGYGFTAAALGFSPTAIGLFMLVGGSVRIIGGAAEYWRTYRALPIRPGEMAATWQILKIAAIFASIDILGTIYNKTNIFFLKNATGVEGVAYYSATWNLVDPVSVLASEQLLGWVIFPLLSALWWKNRASVGPLVQRNAQWLMALAFPIMFFLAAESDLLIGFIYPAEYKDAAWMQKYLVWTILLSFENNLFAYVMMVAGAARVLLAFAVLVTGLNLLYNYSLVNSYGLVGGCLVIILTKLSMTCLTISYCQLKFGFLKATDFLFPVGIAVLSMALFLIIEPLAGLHAAVGITLGFYFVILWQLGVRFLGRFPRTETVPPLHKGRSSHEAQSSDRQVR
jgi:O-antigen/teichoic acid export membrane protein